MIEPIEITYISEPIFKNDCVEYTITVKNNKEQIKKLIELKQLASLKTQYDRTIKR